MSAKSTTVETAVEATEQVVEEVVSSPVNLKVLAGVAAGAVVLSAVSFTVYKIRKNRQAAKNAEETSNDEEA